MKSYIWTLAVLVVVCHLAESRVLVKRDAEIDPIEHESGADDSQRDKRKVDAAFGVKNAVLGFVFNKPRSISSGFSWDKSTTPRGPTTTEDVVIFEKGEKVSLDLPGELFGSSFTLVTNVSTSVGDFMINSALRLQRLLESMRPLLRTVFGAKGVVIEATTDKPIFSDPNST